MVCFRKIAGWSIRCALILLCAALPAEAGVIDPALREALQKLRPGEEVRVILTLSERVDLDRFRKGREGLGELVRALREKADRTQPPLESFVRQKGGGKIVRLWAINGLAFTVRTEEIETLAALPAVERLALDAPVLEPVTRVAETAVAEWNLAAIRAPALWVLGHTGTGTVVAGLDTGVDALHPDLSRNWRGGENSWFDPNGEHSAPYDSSGHGTQAMGLAVGGSAGGTAIGVAPDARWIAVKVFNDAGVGYLSGIHQGFQWLLDPDGNPATGDAPDVVNNSWDIPSTVGSCFMEFDSDLAVLKAAGIAVVFAAGNHGPSASTSSSPANNPSSFAAGAVDQAQNVAYFSSRGPSACGGIFPEVVAPGVNVRTADLTFGGRITDSYQAVTGTSFAAPHIAGAIALLRSAYPDLPAAELERALQESALDLGLSGPDQDHGHGLIDVHGAFQRLRPAADCADADGDGFFAGAGCEAPLDCDDGSSGVHPGAAETKRDGIDQDCNGYDLTIDVLKAEYSPRRRTLTVEASSSLGASAALRVEGFGAMKWVRSKSRWVLTTRPAGGNPGAVTVSGKEGEETATVQ